MCFVEFNCLCISHKSRYSNSLLCPSYSHDVGFLNGFVCHEKIILRVANQNLCKNLIQGLCYCITTLVREFYITDVLEFAIKIGIRASILQKDISI